MPLSADGDDKSIQRAGQVILYGAGVGITTLPSCDAAYIDYCKKKLNSLKHLVRTTVAESHN